MSRLPHLPLAATAPLDAEEVRRYGRHLVIPEVGVEGQLRLKAARVVLIGAGGLGSPASLYLAAAGVGTLGLVEFDAVDVSNLQRQILYGSADVGRPKLEVAAERLEAINPHITVRRHSVRLDSHNVLDLVADYDVVVDGSDNFATRYVVNDACALEGRPLVYGAVLRFEGQVSVFWRPHGPCYRCLFPEPPPPGLVPSCAEAGVLGVLPGMVGAMQANEAIKLILGQGEPLIGRYLVLDALGMRLRELRLQRDPGCPLCGDHPSITAPVEIDTTCEVPSVEGRVEIDVHELDAWRRQGRPHQLIDVREPVEESIARVDGALLVPLRSLPQRLDQVARDRPVVVMCHHGGRSARAVGYLRSQGIDASLNLVGGIDAWSREVDPGVARY
jgi:adenylyltransferase/sulfurtransferase